VKQPGYYRPSAKSCDFYNCIGNEYNCTASDYPISYGLKFCNILEQSAHLFGHEGQESVSVVRLCLQKALQKNDNCKSNCAALKNDAFTSHPKCYVDCGLCNISQDWITQVKVLGLGTLVLDRNAFFQTVKTAGSCVVKFLEIFKANLPLDPLPGDLSKKVFYCVITWGM
jgi:hypothetical protein